jgi:hypothetical protein
MLCDLFFRNVVGLAIGYSKAIVVDMGICLQVRVLCFLSCYSTMAVLICTIYNRVMMTLSFQKC